MLLKEPLLHARWVICLLHFLITFFLSSTVYARSVLQPRQSENNIIYSHCSDLPGSHLQQICNQFNKDYKTDSLYNNIIVVDEDSTTFDSVINGLTDSTLVLLTAEGYPITARTLQRHDLGVVSATADGSNVQLVVDGGSASNLNSALTVTATTKPVSTRFKNIDVAVRGRGNNLTLSSVIRSESTTSDFAFDHGKIVTDLDGVNPEWLIELGDVRGNVSVTGSRFDMVAVTDAAVRLNCAAHSAGQTCANRLVFTGNQGGDNRSASLLVAQNIPTFSVTGNSVDQPTVCADSPELCAALRLQFSNMQGRVSGEVSNNLFESNNPDTQVVSILNPDHAGSVSGNITFYANNFSADSVSIEQEYLPALTLTFLKPTTGGTNTTHSPHSGSSVGKIIGGIAGGSIGAGLLADFVVSAGVCYVKYKEVKDVSPIRHVLMAGGCFTSLMVKQHFKLYKYEAL